MSNRLRVCGVAAVMLILTACGVRGLRGSSDEVQLLTAEQLKGCENVGATHVSVFDRKGHPDWSPDRVTSELRKLAKDGAIQLGGNAILQMTEVIDGAQSFAVFSCRQ